MKPQLTKEAFANFCASKPKSEEFNLYSTNRCAVAQFAHSLGFRGAWPDFSIDAGRGRSLIIKGVTTKMVCDGKRTFGALAKRLGSAS